jgi:hypothetical protein
MINFLRYIKNKYHIDETADVIKGEGELHGGFSQDAFLIMDNILNNYNPETIYENDPRNLSGDTSYTVNKGDKMFVCVRNKDNPNKFVDYNTFVFVVLHEASHIGNYNGWGHDQRFWTVFKFILREAVNFGIYKPVNYDKYPVNYCGLEITYQPLYDKTLPDIM